MQPLTVGGICTLPDISTDCTLPDPDINTTDDNSKSRQMEMQQTIPEPEKALPTLEEGEGEKGNEKETPPIEGAEGKVNGGGGDGSKEPEEGGEKEGNEEGELQDDGGGEGELQEDVTGEGESIGGWMNGGHSNGDLEESKELAASNFETNGTFATKDVTDDPVTMIISPDLPFHLLSPSAEDIDDMEEDLEAEDLLESIDDEGNDDGKVYTDSLSEMCLCVCKVCNTKMKFNSLREHVRIQHNLRMTEYKLKYGKIAYSRMTYHRCKACGKVLRAIYATIKKHLQTVHNLAFKEYANSYNVFKGKFDKVEDINTTEDKIYSDDPSQMCMTVCRVCNMNLEPYNMKNHVKGKHYLSMLEYKTNFGEIKFITEIFHNCKVCRKCVLFEYQKLSNHMFFNHGIGIAKYKDFLLGKVTLGSLKQMEAEAMKSKSTKNGSHEDGRSKSYNDDLRQNRAKRLRTSPFNGYNPYSTQQQNLFLLPGSRTPASHLQPSLALMQSIQDSQKYFHSVQEKSNMQQLVENYQTMMQNQMIMQYTQAAKAASSSSSSASGTSQQLAAAQALLLSSLAARGSAVNNSSDSTAALLSSLSGRGSSGGGIDAATLLTTLAARGSSQDSTSLLNTLSASRDTSGSDAASLLSSLAARGGDTAALLSSLAARGASSTILKNYAAAEEQKKFDSGNEKTKEVSSHP